MVSILSLSTACGWLLYQKSLNHILKDLDKHIQLDDVNFESIYRITLSQPWVFDYTDTVDYSFVESLLNSIRTELQLSVHDAPLTQRYHIYNDTVIRPMVHVIIRHAEHTNTLPFFADTAGKSTISNPEGQSSRVYDRIYKQMVYAIPLPVFYIFINYLCYNPVHQFNNSSVTHHLLPLFSNFCLSAQLDSNFMFPQSGWPNFHRCLYGNAFPTQYDSSLTPNGYNFPVCARNSESSEVAVSHNDKMALYLMVCNLTWSLVNNPGFFFRHASRYITLCQEMKNYINMCSLSSWSKLILFFVLERNPTLKSEWIEKNFSSSEYEPELLNHKLQSRILDFAALIRDALMDRLSDGALIATNKSTSIHDSIYTIAYVSSTLKESLCNTKKDDILSKNVSDFNVNEKLYPTYSVYTESISPQALLSVMMRAKDLFTLYKTEEVLKSASYTDDAVYLIDSFDKDALLFTVYYFLDVFKNLDASKYLSLNVLRRTITAFDIDSAAYSIAMAETNVSLRPDCRVALLCNIKVVEVVNTLSCVYYSLYQLFHASSEHESVEKIETMKENFITSIYRCYSNLSLSPFKVCCWAFLALCNFESNASIFQFISTRNLSLGSKEMNNVTYFKRFHNVMMDAINTEGKNVSFLRTLFKGVKSDSIKVNSDEITLFFGNKSRKVDRSSHFKASTTSSSSSTSSSSVSEKQNNHAEYGFIICLCKIFNINVSSILAHRGYFFGTERIFYHLERYNYGCFISNLSRSVINMDTKFMPWNSKVMSDFSNTLRNTWSKPRNVLELNLATPLNAFGYNRNMSTKPSKKQGTNIFNFNEYDIRRSKQSTSSSSSEGHGSYSPTKQVNHEPVSPNYSPVREGDSPYCPTSPIVTSKSPSEGDSPSLVQSRYGDETPPPSEYNSNEVDPEFAEEMNRVTRLHQEGEELEKIMYGNQQSSSTIITEDEKKQIERYILNLKSNTISSSTAIIPTQKLDLYIGDSDEDEEDKIEGQKKAATCETKTTVAQENGDGCDSDNEDYLDSFLSRFQ